MRTGWRPSAFDVVVLAAGVLLLAMVVPNIPHGVRAARAGTGAHGTFTAQSRICTPHPGHTACNWQGRFRSGDATIDRNDIFLYGSGTGLRPGAQTEARDIGRASYVYPMAGSREWILSALLCLAGLLLILRGGVYRVLKHAFSRTPAPATQRSASGL